MATLVSLDDHLGALGRGGAALGEAAAAAGLEAKVPTCPAWDVTDLLVHQGMVHRWAAANLGGERDHDTAASQAEGRAAASLLDWSTQGLAALVETVPATAEDARAMVFLNDAPPPRRLWARRQAHATTIHSVEAIAARLGRWPSAADVAIDPVLAADGIDELVMGLITRGKGRLHTPAPYRLLVRTDDTGHAWTLRIGDGPILAAPGGTERSEVVLSGTAVQLYLSLWNRADEIATNGRSDLIGQWRKQIPFAGADLTDPCGHCNPWMDSWGRRYAQQPVNRPPLRWEATVRTSPLPPVDHLALWPRGTSSCAVTLGR